MKIGTTGLFLILLAGVCHCQTKNRCSLISNETDQYIPDILAMAPGPYQLAVDFSVINTNLTDYFVEYYDKDENKGRIDRIHDDDLKKYYYYKDGMEAFEISELKFTCEERNETAIPDFMDLGQYDWYYNDGKQMIHGPSAMFRLAYKADKDDHSNVAYMGKSRDIRGIEAQYWRRCLRANLTADYFFSSGSREGVYGVKNLTLIPLRIEIYGEDDEYPEASKTLFPQNYEFMTFTPFLDDPYYTFELPVGMGCGRKPREDDNQIPSFEKQSLFIETEVIYTDYSTGSGASYSSDFTFAFDIDSEYLSYFYTPWKTVSGQQEAGDPISVVYDTKNKYVFNTTYGDGRCVPGGINKYLPKYHLPGFNKGYITLTDPSMFYPNNDFNYLGEGIDRGYKVDMFEAAYPQGYLLGDRVVKNTVVTHYYLKADKSKVGPRTVEQALTRIRISFNGTDDDDKKMSAVLNFNLNSFSTRIEQKSINFDITKCFRDEDDIMSITIGFRAEQAELELISEDIPSAIENARSFIREVTEIPPARVPNVFVDFKEALYVTFVILERPPFQLDFDEPKNDKYISGATETAGITRPIDCANMCLESDLDCWGFAHCGATCYIGAGERSKAKIVQKSDCLFYNRTNFQNVPRLKTIRRNLEHAVDRKEPKLAVAKTGGGEILFTPSYIGDATFGESQEIFDLLGMETDPRLRVVKVGYKLAANTGENIGKNFGKLTYGECQRFCLDFRACETVSFCLSTGECVLSMTHAEDMGDTKFAEDSFCSVLTRKYSDAFTRSPGDVLSQNARKVLDTASEEDCAKACMKETSFNCLSFDNCRTTDGKNGCRLHAVHTLDLKNQEGAVSKEKICGHYSKKYTYDFKRQSKRKAVGSGFVMASGINVEECARYCLDYNQGQCNGFDSCQGKDTVASCVILTQAVSEMKTAVNELCDHFERLTPVAWKGDKTDTISNSVAGGVGFLLFVIGCVLGGLIVYGIAYYRVNRRR